MHLLTLVFIYKPYFYHKTYIKIFIFHTIHSFILWQTLHRAFSLVSVLVHHFNSHIEIIRYPGEVDTVVVLTGVEIYEL